MRCAHRNISKTRRRHSDPLSLFRDLCMPSAVYDMSGTILVPRHTGQIDGHFVDELVVRAAIPASCVRSVAFFHQSEQSRRLFVPQIT